MTMKIGLGFTGSRAKEERSRLYAHVADLVDDVATPWRVSVAVAAPRLSDQAASRRRRPDANRLHPLAPAGGFLNH
ncbi:hypothetical protein FJW05_09080 [Mesorhizobium sp. B2-9-1]|uniref:hypothetical protein n=1 Tax=Mesorhizobium sp. B2-9-1 TaxID=2589898 RepID=UPI0011294527|nr:hypothetical protein [Mesorhizobium sp. B2-9-1]TPI48187.1 hypothetical protein FJW05_09080 [Mesorhizobium sp. B2-9-1]